jgi:oligopeptide transport system substrate-binding protein
MLTYVCFFPVNGKFLAETGKRFGTDNTAVLYNGAYLMDTFEPQSSRELVRNESYWDKGNVLIGRLRYKYNKEATSLGPELFLRGDVSGLEEPLPVNMMDSWMKDPAKKAQIHPAQVNTFSYFYCLNFVPKFEAQYQPDNWKVAVNDKAFRKSLFHGLDRRVAMVTAEPFQPERRLMTTVTPRNFVSAGGKDFVDMPALATLARTESFNKTLAVKYKADALKELAGKVTFPVKIPMPYNASQTDWVNRVQVIEQQMEGLLGRDYIDIIPISYPATGFLDKTRRPGFYAMQECRWGPDYADPQTYTDPFVSGTNYNRPEFAVGYTDKNGKPVYDNLVATAVAEVKDLKKRYELFAKAEAFLINEAFIIPYSVGGGGYEATRLEPFSNPFAPFGVSNYKFKGRTVLPAAVPEDQYLKLEAAWQKARNAAIAKAK